MGLSEKILSLLPASSTQRSTAPGAIAKPEPSRSHGGAARIRETGEFAMHEIDLLADTFRVHDSAPGTPWDDFKDSFLALPEWFRFELDPLSPKYEQQQRRLWGLIAGVDVPYDPNVHEKEAQLSNVDAIRFPGHFVRRDPQAVSNAAEHLLATGMILKNSGVRPGQWALEYGSGFAQTALQLTRLGVNVDTVDISQQFCEHVKTQADFYGVPLTPFRGEFGWNPRGDKQYDLIWFYESFHHCLDFRNVIHQLKGHLAPEGRVLLAGEPIARRENRAVPYPWGMRLHSEVVAVVRVRHWFELGFSEDFIANLFTNAGFTAERMECPVSLWGEGYVLRHRDRRIDLQSHWLATVESESWHGAESSGRWTKGRSVITLDMTDSFTELQFDAVNHHPKPQTVHLQYGDLRVTRKFLPGESVTICIDASRKAPNLVITSQAQTPARDYGPGTSADGRALGIFVTSISYL